MKNKILAVIVSYNPENLIINLYRSINEQVDELIIIDNLTTENNSKKYLCEISKEVKIIYNNKNFGIAKALNQGAKYAIENNYEWLLTLDQDSEFLPNTYNLLLSSYEQMQDKDKVMLIAPQYKERINCNGKELSIDYKNMKYDEIKWKSTNFILTSGSLIKTEVFKTVGFFEEKLFIDKIDFDFSLRIKIKGFILKIAKNVYFIHELCKPKYRFGIKITNMSAIRRYYSSRNAVIMFKKYFKRYPFKMIYILIRGSLFIAPMYILLLEKEKIKKIKNIYKGFFDGLINRY